MYIFAILQDIQHLPWESIPMLFDRPVTRVPSMQFLLSKVKCRRADDNKIRNK